MNRAMVKNIIQEQLQAYLTASLPHKSAIITSVCQVTGMHRKAAIRAFKREQLRSSWKAGPKLGRPRYYTAETDAALAFVWEQYDYPAAERLHPVMPEAIRIFVRDGMWPYGETATAQLAGMSLGAMKVRCVAMAKKRGLIRGISTTRSGELLKSVPVFFGSWDRKGPGHGQVDTVVHSGPKLMGSMVYTVNYIDVATYWQEPVAQLNKSERATTGSLATIQRRLPFPLAGLHPDSGSEFINLVGVAWARKEKIELTRSRPHKKNDNCYVEQRNLVVVRKYVGYERYDCAEAVAVMNELYEVLRLYLNFFQPTFKLVGKQKRVDPGDGKQTTKPYKRMYDQVRTPYVRVLAREDIDQAIKAQLATQYEGLNPKILRDRIQALTSKLERTQRELGYHY
jgi:hypothetical protein